MSTEFSSCEAIEYLEVSEWKFKKLLSEERLTPRVVKSKYGKHGAFLFNVFQLVKVKRELKKEGYKYEYA